MAMSTVERRDYEKDWAQCRRCWCRRPRRALTSVNGSWVCTDEAWCDKVVLWREEQAAVAAEAARKSARRPPRKK